MVLREVKDQLTTVATRTTESVGNGDEHEELKEPYRRSVLARQRRLTGVGRSGGRRRESGPNQGDAAAGLMKTRGATAAAVAELEQRSNGARRKRESVRRKCWADLFIRQVISGREIQGDHGVVISPSRRLDFRKDSNSRDPLQIWRSKKRT